MIIIGDIACPDEKVECFRSSIESIHAFDDEIVVLNLEANILDNSDTRKPLTLWNSPIVADVFSKARIVIVSLANNHAYDYPEFIKRTESLLLEKGIGVFGLYEDDGSIKPFEYKDIDGNEYAFFGHCWRLYTRTNPNTINNVRVVDCMYDEFVDVVGNYCKKRPNVKVYCIMHWNYDLEHLPFPMHRRIARNLIDVGVEAVIGSHSHRPQGAELYKGKVIAYGLGNFYLPSNVFFNGKLIYPDCSHKTYGVILSEGKESRIIWFDTDMPDAAIAETGTETISNGYRIKELSPFANMGIEDYVRYFRKNRLKRTLVPVFNQVGGFGIRIQEAWAIARVKTIRTLLKMIKR